MVVLAAVVGAIGVDIAKARMLGSEPKPTESDIKRETDMIATFGEFFMMRLDDESTLGESLEGLYACVLSGRLSRGTSELVLKKVFCDVALHLQSSANKVRRGAYWLLKAMLEDEIGGGNAAVKRVGEELVGGFINAMDGEKEPRNLQIALLLLPRIVWAIPQHVAFQEDLFEISSCYFPVTFTERADDPNAIRKASLVNALRKTMCAGTEFWIPFLLEKLASTLVESKLETLHSFHHAFTWLVNLDTPGGAQLPLSPNILFHQPLSSTVIETTFSTFTVPQAGTIMWRFDNVQPHIVSIVQALIKEIITTTDEQVAQSACSVIADLTKFIQTSANGSRDALPSALQRQKALQELADTVFKVCLPHLGLAADKNMLTASPDSKLAAMASKIVSSTTCGSKEAAELVFRRVLPQLEAKWLAAPADRSFVIRQLLNLTKASSVFPVAKTQATAIHVDGSASPSIVTLDHPIAAYAENISRIMLSCCQEVASFAQDQVDALETLALIATTADGSLISASTLAQILAAIYAKLIESSTATSTSIAAVGIKLAAMKALLKIHSVHEDSILSKQTMSPVWSELQRRVDTIATDPSDEHYSDYAALVASLHVFCDPSALPSQESDEAPESYSPAPKITDRIQHELVEVLQKRNNDPRIFSILLSSLSRTGSSLQQFKLAFSYVAKNADSEDENWAKAAQKWLPLLAQRIASHVLQTPQERLDFFSNLFTVFIERSIAPLLLPDIVTAPSISPETLNRIISLCIPSLYAACVALPLRSLIDFSSEPADSVGPLTGKLFTLLKRLLSEASASQQGCPCSASASSQGGCGSTAPQVASDRSSETWLLESFGSILNKLPSSPHLEAFVREFWFDGLFVALRDLETVTPCTPLQVQICVVSAKALVQPKLPIGTDMSKNLVTLLKEAKSTAVKGLVAHELRILLEDSPSIPFSAVLYKQRVWALFQPLLKDEYISASAEQQAVYMQATSALLKHLPGGVLIQSAPFLLPILLTTMPRVGEAACDEAVLSLHNMLRTSEQPILNLLLDHLTSVIPQLVQIAASASKKRPVLGITPSPSAEASGRTPASPAARLAAAECLKVLLKLPFVKINPLRNTVVNGLHPALDDPRRDVRKNIVATRNDWYLVTPSTKS